MAAALTWSENIFVGCTVTPQFFFFGRSLPFLILSITKNLYVGSFNYFAFTFHNGVELLHEYRCA